MIFKPGDYAKVNRPGDSQHGDVLKIIAADKHQKWLYVYYVNTRNGVQGEINPTWLISYEPTDPNQLLTTLLP